MLHQDTEVTSPLLDNLSSDFKQIAPLLKKATLKIQETGYEYPIIILTQAEEVPFGKKLIAKQKHQNQWNYYASYLDIFIKNKLITQEGAEKFKINYKDINKFCCLFLLAPQHMKFIYMPYP